MMDAMLSRVKLDFPTPSIVQVSQPCDECDCVTMHVKDDDVWLCTKCYPVADPGWKDHVPLEPSGEYDLTSEIYDAAEKAGYDYKTGKKFTQEEIDGVMEPRKFGIVQPKEVTVDGQGRDREVPVGCPIPGRLVYSAWCDWANGWNIVLTNNVTFQEQHGAGHPDAKSSENFYRLVGGWHVFDGDGNKILSIPSEHPDQRTLTQAWRAYMLHLQAEGKCESCLGTGTQYNVSPLTTRPGCQYPCPECNLHPDVHEGSVVVPLGDLRSVEAASIGTWWRYQGQDMVVARPVKEGLRSQCYGPQPEGVTTWACLRAATEYDQRVVRAWYPEGPGPSEVRAWDDLSGCMVRGQVVLDCMRPWVSRWWSARSLLTQRVVWLAVSLVSGWVLGATFL